MAKPLLTLEALRDVDATQRGWCCLRRERSSLAAPAPSLVEATLGKANAAPTLARDGCGAEPAGAADRGRQRGAAESAGRDGGWDGSPDFVVSAAVFSYIFTLRGNKAWKQPPVTSGR